MRDLGRWLFLSVGLFLGVMAAWLYLGPAKPVLAGNDRYEDYILCTGPVAVQTNAPTDGVWLLDYRAGKLLGTIIDRNAGKIVNWAEVDLVQEFNIPPKQNVHFLMTTGTITQGQAALYLTETTTGRLGIYTMRPRADNQPGLTIERHDMTQFRRSSQ